MVCVEIYLVKSMEFGGLNVYRRSFCFNLVCNRTFVTFWYLVDFALVVILGVKMRSCYDFMGCIDEDDLDALESLRDELLNAIDEINELIVTVENKTAEAEDEPEPVDNGG